VSLLRDAAEYLLGGPRVGGASEERLRRWIALPDRELALPHARARYVVVDTESTGGDPRRGTLSAIGAVGVDGTHIRLADCFGALLRAGRVDADPAGAAGERGCPPAAGVDPALALLDFLEFIGKAPLVAFDAGRERAVLERAMKTTLGVPVVHTWIDLATVLPALFPDARCATREAWLASFGLAAGAWRDALGDAFVTAQMFLAALDAATRAGAVNAAQLIACRPASR
jgi:DNA polymerase III subunit epsilon